MAERMAVAFIGVIVSGVGVSLIWAGIMFIRYGLVGEA